MLNQADLKVALACQSFWIYTDGSATTLGVRSGSYAAMILGNEGRPVMVAGACSETTINRMELTAINAALYRIREISKHAVHGVVVTIVTDSQITQKMITGEHQRKANLDLWASFDMLVQGFENITVIHSNRNTEPPQAQADAVCHILRTQFAELVSKIVASPEFESFQIDKSFNPQLTQTVT